MHASQTPQPQYPEQLGRYQLLRQLGKGGMGTVFLARDTRLDRCVAVKVLPAYSVNDPDAVARFQREARALAKLSHPGIVHAHDSDADAGCHFLVMEYVEGTSLAQLLKQQGRVAPTLAADYARQAALALQHAHEQGLIHRDVKPSNLLLTADGHVKILDLGLARFLQDQLEDPNLTRDGAGLGTPDYAAPEQFQNARGADVRADVYALGCTLYHLIAGRVPFPGTSLAEKCRAHAEREPAPLEELCPEVPAGLALVVARMMAKRPAGRFATMAQVADALAPYVAGASVTFSALKQSASWTQAQLTLGAAASGGPGRWAFAAAGALAALALTAAAWAVYFRGGPGGDGNAVSGPPAADKKGGPGGDGAKPGDEANVLTVARDGSGKFRTLGEALAAVTRPGAVVRILDDATYHESVAVTRTSAHEGLRLEAPRGALLAGVTDGEATLRIANVSGVTVRGLRVRGTDVVAVQVAFRAPGVTLDGLEIVPPKGVAAAISLDRLDVGPGEPPVVVRGCRIRAGHRTGIHVRGMGTHGKGAERDGWACSRALIHDNRIEGCKWGVLMLGLLRDVHVVGNLIWDNANSGLQLEHVHADSDGVLIANNTTLHGLVSFVVRDVGVHGKNFRVSGNLLLGAQRGDVLFLDSGGDPVRDRGPGDGEALLRGWQVERNWREYTPRGGDGLLERSRVPPAPTDIVKRQIEGLSRDPNDPAFLRPVAGPLAGGGDDPTLPAYVGALPPTGAEPWDWRRTWGARARKE